MQGLRATVFVIGFAALVPAALVGGCKSPRATSDAPGASASSATGAVREATIPIEGMSCGSCVARVKRSLKSMDGVVDVEVSLEHRNAVVRFDQAKTTPERLVAAINDLGYTAGTATSSSPPGGAK